MKSALAWGWMISVTVVSGCGGGAADTNGPAASADTPPDAAPPEIPPVGGGDGGAAPDATPDAPDAGDRVAFSLAEAWGESCALRLDGTVRCWGETISNGLEGSAMAGNPVPADVVGLSGARSISLGIGHSCALVGTTIRCWGRNLEGQLGDGTFGDSAIPVTVSGLSNVSNIAAVSAGGDFSCAYTTAGLAYCWGWNPYGQLGRGSLGGAQNNADPSPGLVVGLTGVTALAAGRSNSCAIADAPNATKAVYCWGANLNGELGNGQTGVLEVPTPVRVALVASSKPTAVTVGYSHSCALLADGSVECWGSNFNGQLGNGVACSASCPYGSPVVVAGVAGATAIAAMEWGTCAIANGQELCWGLGAGLLPTRKGVFSNAAAIAGGTAACAQLQDRSVWCWGANTYGEVGVAPSASVDDPVQVFGL